MADAFDPGDGGSDPSIDPATGLPWGVLPPPPPQFVGGGKAPGGGLASPVFVDPGTGEYVDPIANQPTGGNSGLVAPPAPPQLPGTGTTGGGFIQPPPPPPPPPPDSTGPTTFRTPQIPPPPPVQPPPPLPGGPVATAFRSGGGRGMSQGGMGPSSPMASNFRPSVPLWARGLSQSPFAQFQARSAQNPFMFGGGFQPEVLPEDLDEQRRQQMMTGEMPAWALPA